uniref:Uncharacterized protein n=1 Tax=Klebsiella pneumoniae TaxID=573 RepID=A0A5P1PKR6_KLEPN|nr:hypothetical protein [Klebsiella pneumoniae]QEQ70368.1 hypothetical protein [Klebsiella pneumoniae]QVQ57410.1 hypothetical protein [Klebsiella pneumoniae]
MITTLEHASQDRKVTFFSAEPTLSKVTFLIKPAFGEGGKACGGKEETIFI